MSIEDLNLVDTLPGEGPDGAVPRDCELTMTCYHVASITTWF